MTGNSSPIIYRSIDGKRYQIDLPDGPWCDGSEIDIQRTTSGGALNKFGDRNAIREQPTNWGASDPIRPVVDDGDSKLGKQKTDRTEESGICPRCLGDGGVRGGCSRCAGTGYVWES